MWVVALEFIIQWLCPDEHCFSDQDRSRAPPFFKATDVCARSLNDSRYLLLRFAFGQRLLASQYSRMIRRTFTVLHVLFDFLRSAFQLFRYLPVLVDAQGEVDDPERIVLLLEAASRLHLGARGDASRASDQTRQDRLLHRTRQRRGTDRPRGYAP